MKAGIAIDPWKLRTFKRHLDRAGYKYEQAGDDKSPFITLSVETEEPLKLQKVVAAAQEECRTGRKQ